jgi:ligand-binding sensor domain-containing protein/signal transduction histidine kinase
MRLDRARQICPLVIGRNNDVKLPSHAMLSERTARESDGEPAGSLRVRPGWRERGLCPGIVLLLLLLCMDSARAVILWSDPGAMLVFENGAGRDMLEGAVKRDDSSNDTLYFKFHVDPQSDSTTEEYFAAFELYEGDAERLGIGNALKAWAYTAFFEQDKPTETGPAPDYLDLHSSVLDQSVSGTTPSYEFPRRGVERTVVFKVQYVAGGDDLVTVWLNPDLSPGATEVYQAEALTTRFSANAAFDELRLRHGGAGTGWIFSGLAIATSFADFVDTSSAKPARPATDNSFDAQRLSFQSWQRQTGMPRSTIRALTQTRDGYLWLGGDDGLARFDGVRFVSFDLDKVAGGNSVRTLLGDSRGALWIGTVSNGLVRRVNGEFVSFTVNDGLPTNNITALAEAGEGRLWVGTELGLRVWQDGRIESVPGVEVLQDKRITALCRDPSGTLWIGVAGTGVFRFSAGTLTAVTDPQMDALLRQPHCLLLDRNGRIWVGAGDDFVLSWDASQWRRFRIPRHSATAFVSSLSEQPDGTVWAGSTSEGLFQFKRGKLTAVNAGAGLLDNRVTALFADRDGNLWIGRDSGLSRLRRDQLFAVGQGEGLGHGAVHGIAEVTPGVVWAIKPNDGLYRGDGRTFSRLTAAGLVPRDPALGALLVTRDGSCWVAATNGLLLFRDPQAVADESRLLELTNVSITALAESPDHAVWAGSREGELWRLARGKWSQAAQFRAAHAVTALVPETDGSVWVGTDGAGLFRWNESVRAHYNRSNGLSSDVIRTLYRDSGGTLWIGTAGGGLAVWRDGQLASFSTQQGLLENDVSQIIEDDAGRLWLGGNRGIACVNKKDFGGSSPGNLDTVFPYLYGRADGMPSDECSSGFFPSGLKTRSGALWFSTLKGVVVADPALVPTNTGAPTVILEDMLVDGVSARLPEKSGSSSGSTGKTRGATLRIPAGRHSIELHYTSVTFDAPEQMRFRYQLVGLDPGWLEAGSRRVAFYNYVPPGEYRFRVAANSGGDAWSESEATLAFAISRHFWQRWWVLALAAIGLLAGVAAGVRFVEKGKAQRRMKRLEQERALERERHRIAQDLHDEMGAKLCRISFLSEHAQRNDHAQGEVRNQINTIADASRELLHTLDEIVWAVNPRNDTLEHVASYINQYAQNYFHNTGIECELDMPDQFEPYPISSAARHHLFLAVHEAFTNILKHSGATQAKVKMTCVEGDFEIRIEDNGKGFDLAAHLDGQSNSSSEDGLRNMRSRLERVGGQCRMESVPGRGTSIRLTLPLNNSKAGKAAS